LHRAQPRRIVAAMRATTPARRLAAIALCAFAAACGNRAAADPNDREVPWTYGPMQGGATAEHLAGAGKKGGPALAKGWQCRLQENKRLVVRPYQLASSHPLFDTVSLSIGLFDKTGGEIQQEDGLIAVLASINATEKRGCQAFSAHITALKHAPDTEENRAIRATLDKIVHMHRALRTDYQQKFEELIAAYNSGSRNIDELFEELLPSARI
jgi:hypothetical protein